jgi:cytochrome b
VIEKHPRYRNQAILKFASQIERCTNCRKYCKGGIVAAHSNQSKHGKAGAVKAHDVWIAFLCMTCHGLVDAERQNSATALAIWRNGHINSRPLFTHLLTAEGWDILRQGEP